MTKYVHLVFSDPPTGVTEDEFNEWYDAHVQEILAVDGWVAATRYRIAPEVGREVAVSRDLGVRFGRRFRSGAHNRRRDGVP